MNPSSSHARAAAARRAAFTLVEMLTLILILALLMSLRLCALARAKAQTRETQCASNLRQFTRATFVCANENNDKLPDNSWVGNWACDVASKMGDQLAACGADWKVLYCPGTAARFTASANYSLYTYTFSFRVLGYVTTFPLTPSLASTNWNTSLTPPTLEVAPGVFIRPSPAKRVLLADATISDYGQQSYSQRLTYNWTSIQGGFPLPFISPHLNGAIPSGGNQSMLDGHVEWRAFDEMQCRVVGGGPGFWW